jgi:uncharacterized membrane protein YgcG
MTYTARTRDGYRRALAAVTGLTTVGALTACGWLAGAAARDHTADQSSKNAARQQAQRQALAEWQRQQASWRAAQAAPRTRVRAVWKKRPEVTVVDTRVVRIGSIGTGGSLSNSGSGQTYSGSSNSGSGGGGGGRPPVSHPAPPPPPRPAPTSGS